jgi:hypothetical protein
VRFAAFRRVLLLLLALAPAAHALVPADGFVDVDRNGVFSPGDVPLSHFATPLGIYFNELQAGPGWTPRNHPVDVVLARPITLPGPDAPAGEVDVTLLVRGNVRIAGNLTIRRPESRVYVATLEGLIRIAPGVRVEGNGDVDLRAYGPFGGVVVGAGARLSTQDDASTLSVHGLLVAVERDAQFVLSGGGYNHVYLNAGMLVMGPNVGFTTGGRGSVALVSGSNLGLTRLSVRAGYVHIEAYSDQSSPAAKRVRIEDSTLTQTYVHGDYRVLAAADARTGKFAPNAIVLARTKVSTKRSPLYVPDPVIQ